MMKSYDEGFDFTVKMHLNPLATDHTQVILGTAVTFMFV